ncbi:MAG: ribosomal protein S18-alanine N-acetyltransferase [Bryobacteraceae bacterium]|jgi:ribosomal-protein-alanine N-acetyltransferase
MPVIRAGHPRDLAEVAAIQADSPEAAHWNAADYLQYDFRVCLQDGRIAGFLVARRVASDESELLNLVVAPEFRRKGLARALLRELLTAPAGSLYLEVRESNLAARNLYKSMGFQEVNIRAEYYQAPPEAAIVMKFHSC